MDQYTEAFAVFSLTPDADESATSKAYKKLALQHHPDRNGNSLESTQKFQQIGAAWQTCQDYYARKKRPAFEYGGGHAFSRDDDVPLDPEEEAAFFQFLFEEIFLGRYNRTKTRQYRNARAGKAGAGVYTFTESFAESQTRQQNHTKTQKQEHEEYLKRVREFELELEAEAKEERRKAKEAAAEARKLLAARADAFQESLAARTGDVPLISRLFSQFPLEVNGREGNGKKQNSKGDTLLHAAAQSSRSSADMIKFLLERGADVQTLNSEDLTAFHLAVRSGDVPVAKVLLTHKDVHPSRAAKNGQTPLQLAVKSKNQNLEMLSLIVKDATVHDVRRCWEMDDISDEVRKVLSTKNGFADSVSSGPSSQVKTSKGAQRKLADARAQQEKLARIAEEERRAELNRQKRLEKEEIKRIREAEELELRRKAEESDAIERWKRNQGELRRHDEQQKARVAQERWKRQAEEKALYELRIAEERRVREVEQRRLEEQRKREMAEREWAEEERRKKEEEKQRKERDRLAEESARRTQATQRKDAERQRRLKEEEEERARVKRGREQQELRMEEANERRLSVAAQKRQQMEQRRGSTVSHQTQHAPNSSTLHPLESVAIPPKKSRSKRERYTPHEMPLNLTEQQKIKWEAKEARRAEQSARDRARAAEMKLTLRLQQQQHLQQQKQQRDSTPLKLSPVQQGWSLRPEDIQTGPIVDDLFDQPRRQKQMTSSSDDSGIVITDSPEPPALPAMNVTSTFRGYRGHRRGRGRGGRGRGRGRSTDS